VLIPMAAAEGTTPAHVMVVDDDEFIRDMLTSALGYAGFSTSSAADAAEADRRFRSGGVHLIVLDVGLPDEDGFALCRRLRDRGEDVPVIFLTARDTQQDRLSGFVHGGDDYIVKPFSLDELVARVRAVLRRTGTTSNVGSRYEYADLVMDEDRMQVQRAGAVVALSPTEFKLLRFLLLNADRVLSKAQILDHVWQYDFGGDAGNVETYIWSLRRKIDSVEPKLIHTVRGFGYTLRAPT
jgi:two-component system, OmpR family, response regulator